jgi:hypothetical protein
MQTVQPDPHATSSNLPDKIELHISRHLRTRLASGCRWKFRGKFRGWDPKKSRNLIAVSCYFCGWLDFGCFVRFRVGVGIMRLRATDVANILEVGCEVVASYEKDRVVESVP